ncbi:ucpB [Symbiodinium pilosum]|uniref:UcpB protein n=1 Tax=Symbiodinium pilosum TaxID=2952 RepID=A0A812SD44_SYMPI|nr:ucpB [Symbiodinium pilosum]
MKRASDCLSDGFKNRASLLLSRRGNSHLRLQEPKAALRDAVAAMDLGDRRAAEALAMEALRDLGKDEVVSHKILEPVGCGRILDPAAPLVLRCVDRWTADVLDHFSQLSADSGEELPMPVHMPSDRYLDGLDEETRAAVIRKYIPQEQFGGTGLVSNAAECIDLMKKWEEVFSGPDFQCKRKALWDRRDLSFPARMKETRTMVAESLSKVLEPMGYAPGRPGLARCVKQMQAF